MAGGEISAEIIAVGSELLGAERLDTNSLFLTAELERLGIAVRRKQIVGDVVADLRLAIGEALARAEVVIVTGGLGPTEDDVTRAAAAAALGVGLERSPELERQLRAYFARRAVAMPPRNLEQCDLLAGAEPLANGWGTAPGQWREQGGGALVLLPGPPRELQPLFHEQVAPRLRALLRHRLGQEPPGLARRTMGIADRPESAVDEVAAPIYRSFADVATTILAVRPGEIELHFRVAGEAAARRLDLLCDRLQAALGDAVFTREGERLEAVVGAGLRRAGQSVAVAESCTGGLLGARLTAVAGASDYFLGGAICYSDAVKVSAVGVAAATLEREGAVSAACARELAGGIRARLGADWGVAITGIAGPGGGSEAKPVGTVFLALAGPGEEEVIERHFSGDRERIRQWSATIALDRLRRALAGQSKRA